MVTDQEPWLQVDLREQTEVTAVATQGRFDSWDWVSSFLLLYSDTSGAWKQYRQEDGVGVSRRGGAASSDVCDSLCAVCKLMKAGLLFFFVLRCLLEFGG